MALPYTMSRCSWCTLHTASQWIRFLVCLMTDTLSPRPCTCCIIRPLELGLKSNNPPPFGLLHRAAWSRFYWCLPPSIVPRVLLGCHDIEWSVSGSLLTPLRVMVAPKARPCVGFFVYPLHHPGASWRCSALLHWGIHLWCSRSPCGRPLRHVCTWSGPRVPFSLCPLLPPGFLPPSFVLVSLCLCSVLPLLCCPFSFFLRFLNYGVLTVPWLLPVSLSLLSWIGSSWWWVGLLSFEFVCLLLGCYPFFVWSVTAFPPTPFVCPPLWFWCVVCRFLFCWCGASCLVSFVRVNGVVGPASSHGLDRTAANYTGADQWSSLPCCPERPRAAKTAHMVPSVESIGLLHLDGLL